MKRVYIVSVQMQEGEQKGVYRSLRGLADTVMEAHNKASAFLAKGELITGVRADRDLDFQ